MKHIILLLFSFSSLISFAQWQTYPLHGSSSLYIVDNLVYASSNSNTVWMRYWNGSDVVVKSTDGGANFSVINNINLASPSIPFCPVSDTLVFFVQKYDSVVSLNSWHLFKSTDGGVSFQRTPVVNQSNDTGFRRESEVIDMYFYNDSVGWIMGDDTSSGCKEIWTTENGGITWEKLPCENVKLRNRNFSSLYNTFPYTRSITSDGSIYRGDRRWSPERNHLIKVSNYGKLWEEITLPNNTNVGRFVAIDSLTWITATTEELERGYALTRDGGETYTYLPNPNNSSSYLTYAKSTANHQGVLINYAGNGSFISYDTARTWQQMDIERHSQVVFYDAENGVSFSPTDQDGVFRVFTGPFPPPTGIKENIPTSFSIQPNPAKDFITIKNENATDILFAEAISISGESILLKTEKLNNQYQLNISQLPQGIYALKLQTEKGISVKKFVKE